ncbi:MAG: hypothetical protein WBR15_02000 [Gammaproteobacteria bacterium]
MRSGRALVSGLAGMLLCAAALAGPPAAKPVDVRGLITATQFDQTGLNKLSPDELKVLNAWLAQYLNVHTATAPVASAAPLDVRDFMTVTEFARTGLGKLSPDELKAFNLWLNRYVNSHAQTAPVATVQAAPPLVAAPAATALSTVASFGADTMPPKETAQTPASVETRIAGLFTGWTGDTVFKLENGQVWQQAATGYFIDVTLDRPKVVIKKLAFGYLLTLPGHGETVFVRRIK